MNPEEIIRLLEQLAEKLTPAAQHVFDLAVRQIIIDGVFSALMAVGGFIAFTAFWVIWYKAIFRRAIAENEENKSKSYYERSNGDWGFIAAMASMIGGLISFFILVISITSMRTAINYLLNPEYWVLLKLAELLP